jgi:DNA-binding PadR family transcriptional regulator
VIWPAPQNEVYRVLAGLAKEGLAEAAAAGARGAKSYAITAAGEAELSAWLAAPSDYTLRYEPMLKAVFLREADPKLRRERAAADAAFFEAQLAQLEEIGARRAGAHDPRIELRLMAMEMYRGFAEWARRVERGAL